MTITETVAFIYSDATEEDCEAVFTAARERLGTLRKIRAAGVRRGSLVRLEGVSPKYLNGLRGEVAEISGNRCDVKLDERSLASLRFTKYGFVGTSGSGLLRGIPKSTCVVEEPVAS